MKPIAWLVESPVGQTHYTDNVGIAHAFPPGYVVTPLVAAPPQQSVEDVREMLHRYASLQGELTSRAEDIEADAIEARILASVTCVAPPEGASTPENWAFTLEWALDVLSSVLKGKPRRDVDELYSVSASLLASRIPKEPDGGNQTA